jgi:hypothetical protein
MDMGTGRCWACEHIFTWRNALRSRPCRHAVLGRPGPVDDNDGQIKGLSEQVAQPSSNGGPPDFLKWPNSSATSPNDDNHSDTYEMPNVESSEIRSCPICQILNANKTHKEWSFCWQCRHGFLWQFAPESRYGDPPSESQYASWRGECSANPHPVDGSSSCSKTKSGCEQRGGPTGGHVNSQPSGSPADAEAPASAIESSEQSGPENPDDSAITSIPMQPPPPSQPGMAQAEAEAEAEPKIDICKYLDDRNPAQAARAARIRAQRAAMKEPRRTRKERIISHCCHM